MGKKIWDIVLVLLVILTCGGVAYLVKDHTDSLKAEIAQLKSENRTLKSTQSSNITTEMGRILDESQKTFVLKMKELEDNSKKDKAVELEQATKQAHDYSAALSKIDALQSKLDSMSEKCVLRPVVKSTAKPLPSQPPKKQDPVVIINHNHIYVEKPIVPTPTVAPTPQVAPKPQVQEPVKVVPRSVTPVLIIPEAVKEKPKARPNDLLK